MNGTPASTKRSLSKHMVGTRTLQTTPFHISYPPDQTHVSPQINTTLTHPYTKPHKLPYTNYLSPHTFSSNPHIGSPPTTTTLCTRIQPEPTNNLTTLPTGCTKPKPTSTGCLVAQSLHIWYTDTTTTHTTPGGNPNKRNNISHH